MPPPVTVPAVAPGEQSRQVDFSRAVVRIPDGQIWARWESGLLCGFRTEDVRWKSDSNDFDPTRFKAIFDEETARAGLLGRAENLFEKEAGDGLQAGIIIQNMWANVCSFTNDQGQTRFRGSVIMTEEWQIYDPLKREVVTRIKAYSGGQEKAWQVDGVERIIYAAYRENVRALLADSGYRQIVLASPSTDVGLSTPGSAYLPIKLAGQPSANKRTIGDAAGSVVSILADNGHGSGFLVSQDG